MSFLGKAIISNSLRRHEVLGMTDDLSPAFWTKETTYLTLEKIVPC